MDGPNARRILWLLKGAWIGLWTCIYALFAVLYPWVHSFRVAGMSSFPSPGTPQFLVALLGPALIATILTISVWSKRYSLAASIQCRPLTRRDRLTATVCGCILMALVIIKIVGFRHVSPFWPGVIGGMIAIPLLCIGAIQCARVAIETIKRTMHDRPPGYPIAPTRAGHQDSQAEEQSFHEARWNQPPRNSFRARATASEIVYRKPVGMRIAGAVCAVVMGAFAIMCLYFAGGDLAAYSIPTIPPNPTEGLLLIVGFLFCGAIAFVCWMLAGRQELRISLPDRSYTLTSPAPLPRPVARWFTSLAKTDGASIGIPWRMERRTGPCSDMAGVAMQKTVSRYGNYYAVWLLWQSAQAAPMKLAWQRREVHATFFLQQASEDLVVPLLPHLPTIHQ